MGDSKFEIDEVCIKQREYTGVKQWQDAGYLGEGIHIFCDDVKGSHAECVADILEIILPKATVYTGSIGYVQSGDEITQCTILCHQTEELLPFDEFIKKYHIKLLNNSTDGGKGTNVLPIASYMKEKIKQHNLIMCAAAGNGYDQPTDSKYNGSAILVNSVRWKEGKIIHGACSIGENIDFTMFYGWQSGTSFASPFLLGMIGLLVSKKPNLTQDEAYEYLKDHCEALRHTEKNKYFGHGLPILGNPL